MSVSPRHIGLPIRAAVWLVVVFHVASAQVSYPPVDQLEEEWKDYASFQKNELLSFCDFLFDEGYHERAVIACFRFVFLYPNDESLPLVYYRIARSYEEAGRLELAIDYYGQVQANAGENSSEHRSAIYRVTYLNLRNGYYDKVYETTLESQNPYLKVFEGYAHISELAWDRAKASFGEARRRFGKTGHDRTIRRLIRACDGAASLPGRNSFHTGLFGIFPGGGRVYLQDWIPAAGTLISTLGLGIHVMAGGTSAFSSWIPALALAAIYGGSIFGSIWDVEFANTQLQQRYARGIHSKLGPENFIDFWEPGKLSTE